MSDEYREVGVRTSAGEFEREARRHTLEQRTMNLDETAVQVLDRLTAEGLRICDNGQIGRSPQAYSIVREYLFEVERLTTRSMHRREHDIVKNLEEAQSKQVGKLKETIRELLKYGEHPGRCTNEHLPRYRRRSTPCRRHTAASRRREKAARKVLEA